jgi:RimJ/RimL family protein N-acetyltransferase
MRGTAAGFRLIPDGELADGIVALELDATRSGPEAGVGTAFHYTVLRLPDCATVGHVSLTLTAQGPLGGASAQLGFAIDAAHRRRGYAVRACVLLFAVARRLGLTQLSASTSLGNEASRRTLARIGAQPIEVAAGTADATRAHATHLVRLR